MEFLVSVLYFTVSLNSHGYMGVGFSCSSLLFSGYMSLWDTTQGFWFLSTSQFLGVWAFGLHIHIAFSIAFFSAFFSTFCRIFLENFEVHFAMYFKKHFASHFAVQFTLFGECHWFSLLSPFLVACMRLFKPLFWSIRQLVGPSVGWSVTFGFYKRRGL